jgi:DsbC/DsbD-like thiol-disulfide interchange protein
MRYIMSTMSTPRASTALLVARNGLGIALGASLAIASAASAAPKTAAGELAAPWLELANARVRLIAGPPVRAGDTYLAGLQLELGEGWKTYWRMPGDAGVPPNFDWAGSRNVAALTVLYPAPMRLIDPAATSIGYKGSVTFPIAITAQAADQPVALELGLEFGVCRDICIPAEAKLSLVIVPATAHGTPSAALRAAWERVPRPVAARRPGDPEVSGVSALLSGPTPQLRVAARFPRGSAGADLFLETGAENDVYLPLPKRLPDEADGTVRFEIDLSHVGNVQALKGKVLRLTLVSEAAASEVEWTVR